MHTISYNGQQIHEIDNDIYKSKLLNNCDNTQIINIDMSIESYYLNDRINELTIDQLANYIKFWDYMLSDKYFYKGIYELVFIRKQQIYIQENINEIIKYLIETKIN